MYSQGSPASCGKELKITLRENILFEFMFYFQKSWNINNKYVHQICLEEFGGFGSKNNVLLKINNIQAPSFSVSKCHDSVNLNVKPN